MAAAISYYLAIALIPLLVVLLSSLGFFFQWTNSGRDAQEQILLAVEEQMSPALGSHLEAILEQVRENASFGGTLGLLTLFGTSIALLTKFDAAFDQIWDTTPQFTSVRAFLRHYLFGRAKAFAMLIGLGTIVIAVFAGGFLVTSVVDTDVLGLGPDLRSGLQLLLSVSINFAVFTCIYKLLPKTHVQWKPAATGGLWTALIWELGRIVLSFVVIGKKYSAYGVLGAFLAIMLWTYYAVSVVLFGAEITRAVSQQDSEMKA